MYLNLCSQPRQFPDHEVVEVEMLGHSMCANFKAYVFGFINHILYIF